MAYPENPKYKFVKGGIDNSDVRVKTQKGEYTVVIPNDEANTDYQEYLEWAKTNTAEAAEE